MSLINKLLADLEERQSLRQGQDTLVLDGLSAVDDTGYRQSRPAGGALALLFLAATVAAAVVLISRQPETGRDESAPGAIGVPAFDGMAGRAPIGDGRSGSANAGTLPFLVLDMNLPRRVAAAAGAGDAGRTAVHDIGLRQSGGVLGLEVGLSARTEFSAFTLESPSRVVIELNNAEMTGTIPDIDDFPAVKGIHVDGTEPSRFRIVLETAGRLSIASTDLRRSEEGFLLEVALDAQRQGTGDVLELHVDESLVSVGGEQWGSANYGEMKISPASRVVESEASRDYARALELYRNGDIEAADGLLAGMIEKKSGDSRARALLATKLIERGDVGRAAELLREGLQVQPANSSWAELYARILANQGRVEEAVDVLTAAPPEPAAEPEYYAFLAALCQRISRHDMAARIYRRILQTHPTNAVWWMGLGISLDTLQRFDEALAAYGQALRDPELGGDLQRFINERVAQIRTRS